MKWTSSFKKILHECSFWTQINKCEYFAIISSLVMQKRTNTHAYTVTNGKKKDKLLKRRFSHLGTNCVNQAKSQF